MKCTELLTIASGELSPAELSQLKRLMNKAVLGSQVRECKTNISYSHTPVALALESARKLDKLTAAYAMCQ